MEVLFDTWCISPNFAQRFSGSGTHNTPRPCWSMKFTFSGVIFSAAMMKIVIPQAVKNILPTLGNEFISLIKETSVLSFIAVYDLYKALLDIGMVKYDSMIPYLMMGVIYIILVLIISAGIKIIERRFAKSDRN